jgi:hypothetical protein
MEIIHEEFVRGLTFTVKKVFKKSRNGNIQRTVSMKKCLFGRNYLTIAVIQFGEWVIFKNV